jgi:O6-methylguanine-DNA--protein-cysteine methyltransferase
MKQGYTRVALILDRSMSMSNCRESTIAGYNHFFDEQKKIPGECNVKVVQFDHELLPVYDGPLNSVPQLTNETFVPRGNTALLDAQGSTIVALGEELSALSESERPEKVVVVTITDGEENWSHKFNITQVAALIKEQQEKYNWQFVFLGANQDAVQTARGMNIPMGNALTYAQNTKGVRASMQAVSSNVGLYRSAVGQNVQMNAFDEEERSAALGK